jgi:hypothetical protein
METHEYYMVHDHVWLQTGLQKNDGMLCISCLENRIGRTLNSKDFTDVVLNTSSFFPASSKLQDRRTRL